MELGKTIIVTWWLNGNFIGDGIAFESVGTDFSSRFQ